jgi:uncharacterized protein
LPASEPPEMVQDLFDYPQMVETALRGVVREALARTAREGLRGAHHFYVSFRTDFPGVVIPDYLLDKYPEEMTIVLQHQFWGLEIGDQEFFVTLTFQNRPEQLTIPFAAVTSFADPSVKFGLQFEVPATKLQGAATLPAKVAAGEAPEPPRQAAEIVTLDKFRKR